MFQPTQIHLIEPDLAEFGGHFYTQDSHVVEECNARGIPVKVYGRQGTDLVIPGAEMFRTFRFGVWIEPPQIENQNFAPFEISFLVRDSSLYFIDVNDVYIPKGELCNIVNYSAGNFLGWF